MLLHLSSSKLLDFAHPFICLSFDLDQANRSSLPGRNLTSPVITLVVGPAGRIFACHESVLTASPYFAAALYGQFLESSSKRIELPEEVPEVFSSILEFLYKGDYYPRLVHNKRHNAYELEDAGASPAPSGGGKAGHVESTVHHPTLGQPLLKDTLVYCAAERYGLDALKRLALRKQGLHTGVQCATILASARYAYDHTPESDSKLRAHYLALIIRSRHTFKRSGTMQMEMETGGRLFFDLFVAMSNHMVSPVRAASSMVPSDLLRTTCRRWSSRRASHLVEGSCRAHCPPSCFRIADVDLESHLIMPSYHVSHLIFFLFKSLLQMYIYRYPGVCLDLVVTVLYHYAPSEPCGIAPRLSRLAVGWHGTA